MASEIIGIDWAASGLKVAVPRLSGVLCRRWAWGDDVAEAPALGEADPSALRAFVLENGFAGHAVRVAVQRRDVLMLTCRNADDAQMVEQILPPPLTRWQWASTVFDKGPRVVVAIENDRVIALERFMACAGLSLAGVVLIVDPQGGGAATIDLGMNEARLIRRTPDGQLRLQRANRCVEDILVALQPVPVTTIHLVGGGALDMSFAAALRERLGCEVVAPASPQDALYRNALAAAAGAGLAVNDNQRFDPGRPRTWTGAVAALALSFVFGTSAVVARAQRAARIRQRTVAAADNHHGVDGLPSATILARVFTAVPAAMTLNDVDVDVEARVITVDGLASSQETVALMIDRLAAASFVRPRCVKAAIDESRRVKFTVLAGYAS